MRSRCAVTQCRRKAGRTYAEAQPPRVVSCGSWTSDSTRAQTKSTVQTKGSTYACRSSLLVRRRLTREKTKNTSQDERPRTYAEAPSSRCAVRRSSCGRAQTKSTAQTKGRTYAEAPSSRCAVRRSSCGRAQTKSTAQTKGRTYAEAQPPRVVSCGFVRLWTRTSSRCDVRAQTKGVNYRAYTLSR